DVKKAEHAGGAEAFAALQPGSPELHSALAYAAEKSFKAVAIIPVILLVVFGVVWLIERKKKLGDPNVVPQKAN
ncbi:MAG: transporter, partial [Steroidobacteraceae bacterium]|nr:transporter [Steroidobacteraceae bacterium]